MPSCSSFLGKFSQASKEGTEDSVGGWQPRACKGTKGVLRDPPSLHCSRPPPGGTPSGVTIQRALLPESYSPGGTTLIGGAPFSRLSSPFWWASICLPAEGRNEQQASHPSRAKPGLSPGCRAWAGKSSSRSECEETQGCCTGKLSSELLRCTLCSPPASLLLSRWLRTQNWSWEEGCQSLGGPPKTPRKRRGCWQHPMVLKVSCFTLPLLSPKGTGSPQHSAGHLTSIKGPLPT